MIDTEESRRVLSDATAPTPWEARGAVLYSRDGHLIARCGSGDDPWDCDYAALIVHAVNGLAEYADEVDRLRGSS